MKIFFEMNMRRIHFNWLQSNLLIIIANNKKKKLIHVPLPDTRCTPFFCFISSFFFVRVRLQSGNKWIDEKKSKQKQNKQMNNIRNKIYKSNWILKLVWDY